ncbi:MAG: efflux RND transporter periplasmic adaptor subunit [Lentisphaeria bacterium]|nr:efflux RND transporter periplasmic adaptor subunit [Lentisphaeria bacterium]
MGKKIVLLALIAGFAAIAVFAWQRYQESVKEEERKAQKRPEEAVVVNVVKAEHVTMLDERVYSGTTQAWSSFDIDPEVSAKLVSLKFDIGDKIKKGDLIAQLDDSNYNQAVRQAEAELEVAKAKDVEVKAMLKLRKSQYDRLKLLHDRNATSDSEFENAESAMKVQEAALIQSEANIQNCEARLAAAKVKLDDTKIFAEWNSGSDIRHVGDRYVDEGSLVSPGKPILKIIEIDRIKARIPIIERDFRFLQVGQQAEVTTDAYPGVKFAGTVEMISNELAESTRTVVAILSIPNLDFRLRPGMFVRVRIVLSEHRDTQTIPPNAILTRNDQRGVFILDSADQTAEFVPVKTGLEDRTRVEILSPKFNDNDLIVTVGNHMLENGKKAEVSQLSRLHMAEAMAAEAAKNEKQSAQPAAAQDKQPEQQPAAENQPQAVPAESGDKAQ